MFCLSFTHLDQEDNILVVIKCNYFIHTIFWYIWSLQRKIIIHNLVIHTMGKWGFYSRAVIILHISIIHDFFRVWSSIVLASEQKTHKDFFSMGRIQICFFSNIGSIWSKKGITTQCNCTILWYWHNHFDVYMLNLIGKVWWPIKSM